MSATEEFSALEARIGYVFTDRSLLERSLTHSSFAHNPDGRPTLHNQRLEFLGDAVLSMVIAEWLFEAMPNQREGNLTRYRSVLVKGHQLAAIARELQLGLFLRIGQAEENQGGRERQSILEDAFEALIGAIYRDGGYSAAKTTVLHIYGSLQQRLDAAMVHHNPKGRLQEMLQGDLGNEAIHYLLIDASGPDHDRDFTVEVQINRQPFGRGCGSTKKAAEENAARVAIDAIARNGAPGPNPQ